jgi:hypothetical protein
MPLNFTQPGAGGDPPRRDRRSAGAAPRLGGDRAAAARPATPAATPTTIAALRAPARRGSVLRPAGRVDHAAGARAQQRAMASIRARIAEENARAAELPADDARLVLAIRVRDALDGGRAAILAPDKRRDLVGSASRLGLKPFDANLIIAIVQDAARRGEPPTAGDAAGRLAMVRTDGSRAIPRRTPSRDRAHAPRQRSPSPRRATNRRRRWVRPLLLTLLALTLAAAWATTLAWWITTPD